MKRGIVFGLEEKLKKKKYFHWVDILWEEIFTNLFFYKIYKKKKVGSPMLIDEFSISLYNQIHTKSCLFYLYILSRTTENEVTIIDLQ